MLFDQDIGFICHTGMNGLLSNRISG